MTTTKAAHTPGAERAGREIAARFRHALRGLPASTDETLAAIIDKETGAPEMLAEATKLLANARHYDGEITVLAEDCEALETAIQKVKGGQL